jgi:uncharacterized protein (TIGR02246 family)
MNNSQTVTQANDEAALRQQWEQVNDAWGDLERYVSFFTEDAHYVTYDGVHLSGRKWIADGHRDMFAKVMQGSRIVKRRVSVRFLSRDVAILMGRATIQFARQQRPAPRRASLLSLVAVRQHDGRWLFTHFQNTRSRPISDTLIGKFFARVAPNSMVGSWARITAAASAAIREP